MTFIANHEWKKHRDPSVGDIVQLKYEDTLLSYLFKIIVTSVSDEVTNGKVEAVFDWGTEFPVTSGEISNFIGTEISFAKDKVYRVIP